MIDSDKGNKCQHLMLQNFATHQKHSLIILTSTNSIESSKAPYVSHSKNEW